MAALQAAQEAQQRAAADQQALQEAITALAELLAAAEEPDAPQEEPDTSQEEPPSTPSPSEGEQGPGGASALSDAAQLAEDQAAVSEAELRVLEAEHALAAATIVAPIAGTVAAVDVTTGAAADSSATITVVAPGAITVTAEVSESELRSLAVGTAAKVRAAGTAESVSGEVVSIGLIPDTSSGSARYPVVVGVAEPPANAAGGASADVSFLLGEATEVLTVPNSAITLTADGGTVRVLTGGEVETTPVTLGVVGSERTEILDGLSAGDLVVLADLGADLPTSDAGPTGGGPIRGGDFTGGFGGPPPGFG
ncbi:efflux RND transporter periplasmic adaptor subunit [Jiangella alba]|uniref:RND family efflux transporter, MFP subunit n=1 Tax=Jiangella alba TaxID=561176 RepID=A0A1H5PU97_9ACTN|nr:HlyD family efflux transporter periplasmic adaptor subunit [Jiangella alba]SEF17279.1 RND family efflux transporter, MFP subunit [Jiangella alba]